MIRGQLASYGGRTIKREGVHITNPAAIRKLRAALNSLTHIVAGMGSCPAITETARLTFYVREGPAIPVAVDVRCSVTIDRIPLAANGTVGPALHWAVSHQTGP